jgi:hypothetical protein
LLARKSQNPDSRRVRDFDATSHAAVRVTTIAGHWRAPTQSPDTVRARYRNGLPPVTGSTAPEIYVASLEARNT